ncbi:MAG TPA: fibronectin type III domain-containing protein [Anaeromyxobacter sp.]
MMRRVAVLALAVLPLAAGAQALGEIQLRTEDQVIGNAECPGSSDNTGLELTWQIEMSSGETFTTDARYAIWASTNQGCPDNDTNAGITTDTVRTGIRVLGPFDSYPRSGDARLTPQEVLGKIGRTCASPDDTVYLCVRLTRGTSGSTTIGEASGSFELQTAKPDRPTGVSATPSDHALRVKWVEVTSGVEVKDYQAIATNVADANDVHRSSFVSGTDARIEGLELVPYKVTVVARSLGDNLSDPSTDDVTETPVAVDDFFEFYDKAGGRDSGGCGTAGGGGLAAALAALASLRARARRRP